MNCLPFCFNCKSIFFFLGKSDRERYNTRIKNIRTRYDLDVFYQQVSRQEKDLIVKAMGLSQGHWFKCPKGRPNLIRVLAEHATVYVTPKEHSSGLVQFSIFSFCFFLTAMIK